MIRMTKEAYGIIYKITNIITNKVYIGQTITTFKKRYNKGGDSNIERVYNTHKYNKEHNFSYNKHLLSSIEKYGLDSFDVDVEFDIAYSKEELDFKEDYWIIYFDSINNGYNNRRGGANGSPCKETLLKMSITNKGENNPFYGKHHTKEQKIKWSKERKGRKLTDEWKGNLSKAQKGKRIGKNNPSANSVICLTTGRIFFTQKEGAKYYGIKSYKSIGMCCRGKEKHKTCGKLSDGTKLVWRFINWKHNKRYRFKK
jgi:group I intron endonuclease